MSDAHRSARGHRRASRAGEGANSSGAADPVAGHEDVVAALVLPARRDVPVALTTRLPAAADPQPIAARPAPVTADPLVPLARRAARALVALGGRRGGRVARRGGVGADAEGRLHRE